MTPEDKQRFHELVTAHPWRFAVTMPRSPHWYSLRTSWERDEDFVWMVETIREHGYDDPYGGKLYRAIDVGCWKYWTMGSPIPETKLINRKPVDA